MTLLAGSLATGTRFDSDSDGAAAVHDVSSVATFRVGESPWQMVSSVELRISAKGEVMKLPCIICDEVTQSNPDITGPCHVFRGRKTEKIAMNVTNTRCQRGHVLSVVSGVRQCRTCNRSSGVKTPRIPRHRPLPSGAVGKTS